MGISGSVSVGAAAGRWGRPAVSRQQLCQAATSSGKPGDFVLLSQVEPLVGQIVKVPGSPVSSPFRPRLRESF